MMSHWPPLPFARQQARAGSESPKKPHRFNKVLIENVGLFIALPEYPLGSEWLKVLSWDTLRNNDAYYQERFDAIREHFPAESTAIIASRWRHVQWYLPGYRLLPFSIVGKWEPGSGSAMDVGRDERLLTASELGLQPDASGQVVIVLFDPELRSFNLSAARITCVALSGTGELNIMPLTGEQQLFYGADGFGVQED